MNRKKGELPRLRIQTYKTEEARRRSYFKHICKEGLYSPLRNGIREPLSDPYGSYNFFNHGYPLYRASKSRARDDWERIGDLILEENRKTDQDRRREVEEELLYKKICILKRFANAERETGWCAFSAIAQLGLEIDSNEVENWPATLIEAKQFQMGLTTLIGQKTKARRSAKKTHRP